MYKNKLLSKLEGGDLRSDGRSDEVVQEVLANLSLLPDLIIGLASNDDVVRGRTADSIEKVARTHHELVKPYLPTLLRVAKEDNVYMVRFHIAMLLGYIEVRGDMKKQVIDTLLDLLNDNSVFVISWSITSLTIIGLDNPSYRRLVIEKIKPLLNSESIAVRRRAERALSVLNGLSPLPKGWIKKKSKP